MEASSIPAAAAAPRARTRPSAGPLLRLRSDEQLVKLFRAGNEDAFRAIHDRYRARLFAYARQMLAGSRQDAEDALQDVFVRAYSALRANDREVSLRAWLYRVAHNRCIDELRRPAPPPPETLERLQPPSSDPLAETEQKESLRRLVEDVRRLPEQQRSALLMREIVGMSYADLATALDVTVPAVKSLLVRARLGLAQAAEARDTTCVEIRDELTDAHDRGVRASGLARRHMHDCAGCRAYRRELKTMRERFAALTPALGPFALIAKLLGLGGGGAAAGGTAASGGAGAAGAAGAAAGGAAVAGAGMAIGGSIGAGHVAAVVAAAVVGAGGAVEVQRSLSHDKPAKQAAADVRAVVPVQKQAAAAASVQATPARATAPAARAQPAGLTVGRDGAGRPQVRQTVSVVRSAPAPQVTTTAPAPATTGEDNGNGGAAAPADPTMELPPAETPPTNLPAEPVTPTPGAPGSGTATDDGVPSTGAPTAGTGTTTPPASAPTTTGTAAGTTPPPATPTPPPSSAPAIPATPAASGGASAAPNTAP